MPNKREYNNFNDKINKNKDIICPLTKNNNSYRIKGGGDWRRQHNQRKAKQSEII